MRFHEKYGKNVNFKITWAGVYALGGFRIALHHADSMSLCYQKPEWSGTVVNADSQNSFQYYKLFEISLKILGGRFYQKLYPKFST